MNIFYVHSDPKTCAQQHVDKHVVKMILESCQLMSTAHRILDGTELSTISASGRKKKVWQLPDNRDSMLYSCTHANHPSAIWVRKTDANYTWLYRMFGALMDEYSYRYGKTHACEKLADALSYRPKNIQKGEFTEPTPAMPDQYKVPGNSIAAYRAYYLAEKIQQSRWTKRPAPAWINLVA